MTSKHIPCANANIKSKKRRAGLNRAEEKRDRENNSDGGRMGCTVRGISHRDNRASGKCAKIPSKFSA